MNTDAKKIGQKVATKTDEHKCKENRTKSCECAGIHNHRKEAAPNSQ